MNVIHKVSCPVILLKPVQPQYTTSPHVKKCTSLANTRITESWKVQIGMDNNSERQAGGTEMREEREEGSVSAVVNRSGMACRSTENRVIGSTFSLKSGYILFLFLKNKHYKKI